MPGIGYTFQDTDMNESGGSRTWIVIAAIVTLATVGVILLVRAFGDDGDDSDGFMIPITLRIGA